MTIQTIDRIVKSSVVMTLLLVLMSLALARGQNAADILAKKQAETMLAQEQEFDNHWQKYRWAQGGCPMPKDKKVSVVITDASYCNMVPEIKIDEKRKARELAKRVFGLAEPK